MKSLRSQLILSHILPLLILIPLLGILLAYIVETQVVLTDLADDLASEAKALAGLAQAQRVVLLDQAQAEIFARAASAEYDRNIAIYQANGAALAVVVESNAPAELQLTTSELEALNAGQTQTRTFYNLEPSQITTLAFAPVLDPQQRLIGIVRVSEHVDRLNARLTQLRLIILGATLLALCAAVGIGAFLADRTARRLNAVTNSIMQIARGSEFETNTNVMPREFRATFDAVSDLQKRLRESEETRKRLLANLVHELGRPLGALQAAIHALQQGADNDAVMRQELLQGMDAQVERLKPLLDNLASLHGGLSGALELHRELIAPSDWLPKTIITWREAAEQKNLKWVQAIPNDLPQVSVDADKMAQVIGNLLANAIKYTPEGGEVALRAGQRANQVWIEVRDTGMGISPQDQQHIFDPFYRGHNARFPQGMGLGLSIARDIVNAHGGRIEVESKMGEGSRFTVILQR